MREAFYRLRARLLMAVSRWRSSRAFAKAMRERHGEDRWFIGVALAVQCVLMTEACAHQHRLRVLSEIEMRCDAELRHVANTTPDEGMGARLDAVQARCDAEAEGAAR